MLSNIGVPSLIFFLLLTIIIVGIILIYKIVRDKS